MNVLSLFDGISVAHYSLEIAEIEVKNYYSSEIDKYAISVSKKNYPNIIRLGNVCDISINTFEPIDLLIGGSPCQDLSIAKKDRKGLNGDRSGLFWQYIRIRNLVKPKYFILENVASMPQKDKDIITEAMGVQPVMFNASLVSAQTRKRYFWTNIKFELPLDKGILLKDILQEDAEIDERFMGKNGKSLCLLANYQKRTPSENELKRCLGGRNVNYCKTKTGLYQIENKIITTDPTETKGLFITEDNKLAVVEGVKKGYTEIENNQSIDLSYANCKTTRRGRVGDKVKNLMTTNNMYVKQDYNIRKLTPIECERLQSLKDNYTEGISNTQRYKCLGNAFNAEVIAHILKQIK